MYLPDVNVWIALAFPLHTHHESARAWFDGGADQQPCHFCRMTQMGFLRIANSPAAMLRSAVTQHQAWHMYDHFRAHPRIEYANEPAGIEAAWRSFTQGSRFSPKIWTDAYLAAFAQAADFELVTFDRGFSQYSDIRCAVLA